ncbi:MAG: hypothetical protein QUU85_00540, partial [Candidatus Eisenbacteria bacterium]|nr:hypothetical protein [Candidatus Eisenbacteria bacterium]
LISRIPASKAVAERTPADRSKLLILHASSRAALTSATLSIPPGPLGLATVLPDLMAIWRIQRQLVADIAALHGKTARLGREEMAYCLFRHAAGQVVRDVVMRAGERYVVRRTSMEMLRSMLRRVGVSISERAAGRAASRWLPVVGAVGIGAYAYYDTAQVGKTALAFFAADIDDTRDQAGTQT